jgi:hypothetical protein
VNLLAGALGALIVQVDSFIRKDLFSVLLPGFVLVLETWIIIGQPSPPDFLGHGFISAAVTLYLSYIVGFCARQFSFFVAEYIVEPVTRRVEKWLEERRAAAKEMPTVNRLRRRSPKWVEDRVANRVAERLDWLGEDVAKRLAQAAAKAAANRTTKRLVRRVARRLAKRVVTRPSRIDSAQRPYGTSRWGEAFYNQRVFLVNYLVLSDTFGKEQVDKALEEHPFAAWLPEMELTTIDGTSPRSTADFHEVFHYCKIWLRTNATPLSTESMEIEFNLQLSIVPPLVLTPFALYSLMGGDGWQLFIGLAVAVLFAVVMYLRGNHLRHAEAFNVLRNVAIAHWSAGARATDKQGKDIQAVSVAEMAGEP